MFVYLFNFIVIFQPYYWNFFYLSFPPRLAIRLLCGQGSIMAWIQRVFNNLNLNLNLKLETWNLKLSLSLSKLGEAQNLFWSYEIEFY